MALLLRDPLFRELLMDDYDRQRTVRPYHVHYRQPVRARHEAGWPLVTSFDQALNELQNVMEGVNDAIDQYQNSLTKDLAVGGMRMQRKEDGNLQVAVDVSQFKPEEVHVKLCDDNLVVEGKTETSQNDSYHKAEFKRWIKLPADVKHDAIKSTLTHDNRLVIDVPVNKPIQDARSRSIPIQVQKQPAVENGTGDKANNKQENNKKQ